MLDIKKKTVNSKMKGANGQLFWANVLQKQRKKNIHNIFK